MKIDVKEINTYTDIQILFGANRVLVTNRTCIMCGNKFYLGSNSQGQIMGSANEGRVNLNGEDNNACSTCQFWTGHALSDLSNDSALVIKGQHYMAGNRIEGVELVETDTRTKVYYKLKAAKKGTGFGGDPFVIRKQDGQIIVTTDMWHQGDIPALFSNPSEDNLDIPAFLRKHPMKDNAEMVEV